MYCLSSFCCVCLSKSTDLVNLNKLDDDSIPIINKLIFIAFGHERLDLDVTKLICNSCLGDLRIAYKFKTTCLTSNELILGYNSQMKYFTGFVGAQSDLKVTLSDSERVLTDKKAQEEAKKAPEKKYKPRPKCKQEKYRVKKEPEEVKKNMFKCKHCSETFPKGIMRLIHFNKKHHKNLLKNRLNTEPVTLCNMCQKSFPNQKLLKCHMFKVHFIKSRRFCRPCKHHFASRNGFLTHIKNIHNFNNFTCNICNTKYIKEINYQKHMTMHAENKVTKRKRNRANQAKKLKMITRYLVCKICDEIFVDPEQLETHSKTHEPQNESLLRQILADPPQNLFEMTQNNIEDIDIKLEPIVEIKEEMIDDVFVPPVNPLNNNDFQAPEAPKINDDSEVELNKYKCTICDKQFHVQSFLNAHLLIHNGVGPSFQCVQCKTGFPNQAEFAEHILSNVCSGLHPTKHFACHVCFKLFTRGSDLEEHVRRTH